MSDAQRLAEAIDDPGYQSREEQIERDVAARLLDYLHHVSSEGDALDEAAVRTRIILFLRTRRRIDELRGQFFDRHDDMVALSDKLRETRDLIKTMLETTEGSDMSGGPFDLMRAMQSFLPGVASADNLYKMAQSLLTSITIFETIMREASERSRRPNHRPIGSGEFSRDDVRELAQIFWMATGRDPNNHRGKRGGDWFREFVKTYLSALGIQRSGKQLDDDLRNYLKGWASRRPAPNYTT